MLFLKITRWNKCNVLPLFHLLQLHHSRITIDSIATTTTSALWPDATRQVFGLLKWSPCRTSNLRTLILELFPLISIHCWPVRWSEALEAMRNDILIVGLILTLALLSSSLSLCVEITLSHCLVLPRKCINTSRLAEVVCNNNTFFLTTGCLILIYSFERSGKRVTGSLSGYALRRTFQPKARTKGN